jgi:hypothetical protein
VCFAAQAEPDGLPSFIDAAGGAFGCGLKGLDTAMAYRYDYPRFVKSMRGDGWRTAVGAFNNVGLSPREYVGHGKVTLWPALLGATNAPAAFPNQPEHFPAGRVTALFDTMVAKNSRVIETNGGMLRWETNGPLWFGPGNTNESLGHAVRRPYVGAAAGTGANIPYQNSVIPITLVPFAGDRVNAGTSYEWRFCDETQE